MASNSRPHLPELWLVTRDGQTLAAAAPPAAAEFGGVDGGAGLLGRSAASGCYAEAGSSQPMGSGAVQQQFEGVFARSSSSSWLTAAAVAAPLTAGRGQRTRAEAAGSLEEKSTGRNIRRSSSSRSLAGGTVYQQLADYDERYRYTRQQLLALAGGCSNAHVAGSSGRLAAAGAADPDTTEAVVDSSGSHYEPVPAGQAAAAGCLQAQLLIPDEIRSGTDALSWR